MGPGDVLDLIRREKAVTRGDIRDATGLSRVTVAQRLDALLDAGLVVEEHDTESTGGRRRRRLTFNVNHSHAMVAAVETSHTRTAITDLAGRILCQDVVEGPVDAGPTAVLDALAQSLTGLMREAHVAPESVCGMGVSIPGPVDPRSGRPSQPPIMPGWDAYPIAEHLLTRLPNVPVTTTNDADAAAVGEYATSYTDTPSLCLVKVSTGIGAGIVIDGRPYRGIDGGAGDIGHIHVPAAAGRLCHCGGTGCLATIASGNAVARELRSLGVDSDSARDVAPLLAAGDVQVTQLTQEAGRQIGEVLAGVVSVLNPGVVVVGGALASAPLLAGVRESLYRLCLPRATRNLTLNLTSHGDDGTVHGVSRLVVDDRYSPATVNRMLG